jgi:hypothetical protein
MGELMDGIDEIKQKIKEGNDLSNEDAVLLIDDLEITHAQNMMYARTLGEMQGRIEAIIIDLARRKA